MPEGDLEGRLRAIGLAYRAWAHTYPQRYQLIFGTPIPGYEFPQEAFPASTRSITALFSVVEGLYRAGRLKVEKHPEVMDAYQPHLEQWRAQVGEVHPAALFAAMCIWARVHGIVSLEIQGNLLPFGERGDALYSEELEAAASQFIRKRDAGQRN